jgi:hypothetical protein
VVVVVDRAVVSPAGLDSSAPHPAAAAAATAATTSTRRFERVRMGRTYPIALVEITPIGAPFAKRMILTGF